MRTKCLILFLFLLSSLHAYTIGIDPSWYPLNFGVRTAHIYAFTQQLIQTIAEEQKIQLELFEADTLQLLSGFEKGEYEAILTTMEPDLENREKYTFSNPYLLLGPVLIVPTSSSVRSLEQLHDTIVGISLHDNSVLIVQNYPSIVIRKYQNMPTALTDLVEGNIDAVLLDTLEANALISNLYSKQLKIVTPPLNNAGMRVITLKGHHEKLIEHFNKGLKALVTSGQYQKIRQNFLPLSA